MSIAFGAATEIRQAARAMCILVESFIVLLLTVSAAAASSQEGQAHLVLDEAIVNMGKRLCYQEFSHTFTLRNEGSKPLRIAIKKASCRCTSHVLSGSVIPPASSGGVSVGYQPKSDNEKVGERTFSVELSTNDPANEKVVLMVKASLVEQVHVEPEEIRLQSICSTSGMDASLKIFCLDDGGVPEVLSVQCLCSNVQIERKVTEHLGAMAVHTYTVGLTPGVVRAQTASIVVNTNSPRIPILEIPVKVEMPSLFDATPPRISFGIVKSLARPHQEVILRAKRDGRDAVSCRSSDPRITATLGTVPGAKEWILALTLNAPTNSKTVPLNAEILILDEAGSPVASLPVMATLVP